MPRNRKEGVMRSLSIFSKIWLSIGILIVGYLFSLVVGLVLGHRTITYLQDVSNSLFPAAKRSQVALATYNEQVKLYRDAVMLGELSLVEAADRKAQGVREALEDIVRMNQGMLSGSQDVAGLLHRFDHFRKEALDIYTTMSTYVEETYSDEESLKQQARLIERGDQLQTDAVNLRSEIEKLERFYSLLLRAQIDDINHKTSQQQYLNVCLFILVVSTSIILIAFIISRSIKKPLEKSFMLENAVKQSSEGIAVIGIDGTLKYGNRAWADMHGYHQGIDSLIGEPVSLFFPEETYETNMKPMLMVRDGQESIQREMEHQREDGSVFPSIMSLSLLQERGAPLRFVSIARDITERKNAEQKIRERTVQLSAAMDALWGEMELAKKLQTTLLPVSPSVREYEIAAHMVTADEVGGDYYDIINSDDREWVMIGDVSGHGITAGLVMMMAQTSIRTILSEYPDIDPPRLLSIVNRTISENIKKLGEQKYMTMTVIACVDNGRFYFSGLHQDIMIYRKDKALVECVETRGMWIGLVDEISQMTYLDSFELAPGDVMLLFTDGITEAVRQGIENDNEPFSTRLFSEIRLRDLLEKWGQQEPAVIKDRILGELKAYTCDDDITLVILKRNETAS